MTSNLVPPVDLAPGMPSRVVTISATDITEGGKSMASATVTFALSDSLDVTSGGDVIAKTTATVTLDSNGDGRIRLPVYDDDVKTWCGQDWAILVSASWGSRKAIRVPAGSSSIALAALPNVRPLTRREQQWAVTGATVAVTTGSPGGTVTLDGGILRFNLSIPEASFTRGILANGTDTRTMRGADWRGQWTIPGATAWASMSGLPEMSRAWNAQLTAFNGPPGYASRNAHDLIVLSDPPARFYRVEHSTNVWSDWIEISQYPTVRGVLVEGANLNEMRGMEYVGQWYVSSGTTITGYPVDSGGIVDIKSGPAGYGYTVQVLETFGGAVRTLKRAMSTATAWSPWAEGGSGGGEPTPADPWEPTAAGMRNADLLGELAARKGGSIGTSGRTAFALRLDHGTTATREHLLPMLRAYGLPSTMAVYSKQNEVNAENHTVPWDEVASWHHEYGMTFGNHSDDHLDKPGPAGWHGGTIGSLAELKALMPLVPIEQYIPHGSTGFDRYGGFNRGTSHELIVGTLAGRMVLSSHALTSGYRGGALRTMTGTPMQGLTHWSMENSTVVDFKAMLDRAILNRRGLAVMFHPEFIGQSGKMSWADVDECLAYVAQKRDEGDVLPLTLDGLALAKLDSDYREDLATDPSLENPVAGTASSAPGAVTVSSGQYARVLVNLGYMFAPGSTRSAEWQVNTSSSSTVKVVASDNSASPDWVSERTLTIPAGISTVHTTFGIPLGESSFRIELHAVSGTVTASEVHCYSV